MHQVLVLETMHFCNKCTTKQYSFRVIDSTLASDNPVRFSQIRLGRISKPITTTDDEIQHKEIIRILRQYDIIREAAKISALSPGKIDKYEYFTGEEILPLDQMQNYRTR